MHKFQIVLLGLILVSEVSLGQTECDTIKHPLIIMNSYSCKWKFVEIDQSVNGVVVEHYQSSGACGGRALASLTIVKTDMDTMRILDLCNGETYLIGQKVKVAFAKTPGFQVQLPCSMRIDGIRVTGATRRERRKAYRKASAEQEKQLNPWVCGSYDTTILKTAWGQISVIP